MQVSPRLMVTTGAAAAGTTQERVAVHVLHQHDAPRYDAGAEQILIEAGIDPGKINPTQFDGTFARDALRRLTAAVKSSLANSQPVTHFGLGKATVEKVASNRMIYGPDGKVRVTRMSSTKDPELHAEPEGLVDPELSLVSFWNQDKPVAVLSFYASHPQSYYRTGIANPDFVGVARFLRQLAVPDALHMHFNGAGGNIAAGKYNDGSHENRLILAQRLADGMKRAWDATRREPIQSGDLHWTVNPVALPPGRHLYKIRESLAKNNELLLESSDNARQMAWLSRSEAGKKFELACLTLNKARLLFMPGELFVEYQLAAKSVRPDLFVAMAAYGLSIDRRVVSVVQMHSDLRDGGDRVALLLPAEAGVPAGHGARRHGETDLQLGPPDAHRELRKGECHGRRAAHTAQTWCRDQS